MLKMSNKGGKSDAMLEQKMFIQTEDINDFNCWDIFCFPYTVCSKICDICSAVCTSSNQLGMFLLTLQWCICKFTRLTTPNPMVFPYYFYMFGQIFFMSLLFYSIWYYFGQTVFLPFFYTFYEAIVEDYDIQPRLNKTRKSFRKYCFRRGDLLDASVGKSSAPQFLSLPIFTFVIEVYLMECFK